MFVSLILPGRATISSMNRHQALRAMVTGGAGVWAAPACQVADGTPPGRGLHSGTGKRRVELQFCSAHQNDTVVTVSELIILHTDAAGGSHACESRGTGLSGNTRYRGGVR